MKRLKRSYEPVRKVNSRSSLRMTGRFPSYKMGRCCSWESLIERDFICFLEFDREVVEYCEQPFWVEFTLDGKEHRACPDFVAIHVDGREKVWEVKTAEEAEEDETKSRFAAMAKVLGREGREFDCITDEDIREGRRLQNIKALFDYLHVRPNLQDVLALCGIFGQSDVVTLGGLMRDGYSGRIFEKPAIYALLAQRVLDMDIEGELNDDTEVRDFCIRHLLQSAR